MLKLPRLILFLPLGAVAGFFCLQLALQPNEDEFAFGLLEGCISGKERRCYAEGDLTLGDVTGRPFAPFAKTVLNSNSIGVHEFVSPDGAVCAYVEVGRGRIRYHYAAQFYRCAERKSVHLGIG
jgi:hypothetical protein